MNVVWDLGRWSLSDQWDYLLCVRLTPFSTLMGFIVLLSAAAFILDCRRREGVLADRARVAIFLVNLLALLLLCAAGDILTFYFAWFWVVLSGALLNPHDSHSDGVPFSMGRWVPAAMSQVLLLLALILMQAMAQTTDWGQISQWAVERTETPGLRKSVSLLACVLAAWMPFYFIPARREDLWTRFQFWSRSVVAPVGAVVLLRRVGFLAALQPEQSAVFVDFLAASAAIAAALALWKPMHRLSLTAFAFAVGAAVCSISLSGSLPTAGPLRLAVLSALLVGVAAARLRSAVWKWNAPEDPVPTGSAGLISATTRSWRRLDQSFWDGLWQVPVRLAHAVGGAFVYWQGNSAQYTIVVILIGTLLFFWAALKTQVIW